MIEMSPKRRILSIIISISAFAIVSAIFIFMHNSRMNYFYSRTIEITYNDSINLKVEKAWMNHGYLYLNDTYFLQDSRVNQPTLTLDQVTQLRLPFYLTKRSLSDTLLLKCNNNDYIITLK